MLAIVQFSIDKPKGALPIVNLYWMSVCANFGCKGDVSCHLHLFSFHFSHHNSFPFPLVYQYSRELCQILDSESRDLFSLFGETHCGPGSSWCLERIFGLQQWVFWMAVLSFLMVRRLHSRGLLIINTFIIQLPVFSKQCECVQMHTLTISFGYV